ncbi:toll/interleukin-1 receptor domain-containing protein [Aeromonas hydrophila]|uniref:toll/interleukin-1 receptor domain-containing protein n=1 Tax=Aeromonas hydrophila TaxID=644 RepID=UPI000A5AFC5A|nr:toll/interleukin-1 receptor domain-containing protein [Aeromonas hydrophila]MCP3323144.1 toll/interleukin-1 receptor domain-containing protein [Aeromonas hydrophila]
MKERTTKYLQNKYPKAVILSQEFPLKNQFTQATEKIIYGHIAVDPDTAVKHRLLAIPELGKIGETASIAQNLNAIFDVFAGLYIGMGNDLNPTGTSVDSFTMPYAPKILLYTDGLKISMQSLISEFQDMGHQIEVVDESSMYNSIFISYGGPDQEAATILNRDLKAVGVSTWFFPEDSIPGQKLHRMMHEGVNKHDKVLLICSRESLTRNGVLNEIERVLEREAKEGGADILIPVTLDDYIFNEWNPERADIAEQLKTRVIINVDPTSDNYGQAIEKLVKSLKSSG